VSHDSQTLKDESLSNYISKKSLKSVDPSPPFSVECHHHNQAFILHSLIIPPISLIRSRITHALKILCVWFPRTW